MRPRQGAEARHPAGGGREAAPSARGLAAPQSAAACHGVVRGRAAAATSILAAFPRGAGPGGRLARSGLPGSDGPRYPSLGLAEVPHGAPGRRAGGKSARGRHCLPALPDICAQHLHWQASKRDRSGGRAGEGEGVSKAGIGGLVSEVVRRCLEQIWDKLKT